MLASLFALLPLLPLISALQLAGNENYARDSRRLLRPSLERRSSYVPAFQPESVSFTLGPKEYISPTGGEFKSYTLDPDFGLDEYAGKSMLVTVIPVEGNVTCDALGKMVDEYTKKDDVWDKGFMQAIVLTSSGAYHVNSEVAGCVKSWGGSLIVKAGAATSSVSDIGLAHVTGDSVPPGPYFAKITSSLRLTQVYRSFKDEQQAFTAATVPTTNLTFVDLSTPLAGLNTISIPVPSRLYTAYMANPRPLEGRRVAVKDLFDMAGMRTGGGSRAYWNTYPERQKTAVAVQRLIDQGAVIVGRTKSSQFANGESATADWVDQMCPFNPRGDGYQQPSSSSSGSGASIAAYDWLDNTIGSDTGGSITGPAGVQGVYGMRPTWGAISLEGAIPLQATQDTAGAFDRSAVKGAAFVKGWYGDKFKTYPSMPSTLIFPNSSWTFPANSSTGTIFSSFRTALTAYAKPTSIETQDFEGYWNTSGRFQTYSSNSSTYLNAVYGTLITYFQWTNFGVPWIADYQAQNEGRVPFISPSPLVRWNYGRDNVTQASFDAALGKKQVYEDFIKSAVLQPDAQRCSRAIYLAPNSLGTPSYRNAYRTATTVPLSGVYTSQFAGIPQLIVPLGQVPYTSTITNKTEYLPVTVSMFAAAGCDYVLWDIAAALESSGAIKAVKAGRVGY